MARPNKLLRHNILIVCEGKNTEPQYFEKLIPLAKEAWSEIYELYVELSPKPVLEEEKEQDPSKHKTPRKRRPLKQVAEELPPIENAYKAVPVRYVREAQQGLEDSTYEEVWAVFDKNGHPKHQEAFQLAEQKIDSKKVNIAFSSISFEQWVLLHFEKSLTAFEKSECKEKSGYNEKKKSIACGTSQHQNDCFGKKCVSGYIKNKGYLEDYSKGGTATYFEELHPHFPNALENAAWLRHQMKKSNPSKFIYQLNPYTNLDDLVKHLLHIQEEIVWTDFAGTIKIPTARNNSKLIFTVRFVKNSNTLTELHLTNHSNIRHLVLPKHLFVVKKGKKENLVKSEIIINASKTEIVTLNTTNFKGLTLNFLLNAKGNHRILIDL